MGDGISDLKRRGLPWEAPSLKTKFKPCAIEYEEAGMTEVVLKDCVTIWCPWGTEGIELGYDENGLLIAVRLPELVSKRV